MGREVVYKGDALKALERIPKKDAQRIVDAIDALSDNPIPVGAEQLKGMPGVYRIRIGDYRVVYDPEHESDAPRGDRRRTQLVRTIVILVIRVGHRKDVYRVR